MNIISDPGNPASLLNPANPGNPASPLHPMHQVGGSAPEWVVIVVISAIVLVIGTVVMAALWMRHR